MAMKFADRLLRPAVPKKIYDHSPDSDQDTLAYYFWDHDYILATSPRMGSTSLIQYVGDLGKRKSCSRIDNLTAARLQKKGVPVFHPVRHPYERLESAWYNPDLRRKWPADTLEAFFDKAYPDKHVKPFTEHQESLGMDLEAINWVPWAEWTAMYGKIHNNRTNRPNQPEIPARIAEIFARDLEIFMGVENEQKAAPEGHVSDACGRSGGENERPGGNSRGDAGGVREGPE